MKTALLTSWSNQCFPTTQHCLPDKLINCPSWVETGLRECGTDLLHFLVLTGDQYLLSNDVMREPVVVENEHREINTMAAVA